MIELIRLRRDSGKAKPAVFILTLLWLLLVCASARVQDASASQGQPSHHVFTPLATAKAIPMEGASQASVHSFKADDGTLVYQSDDWYKSTSEAVGALDRLTKKASRIIKRGIKKNAKGRIIGKRVELVYGQSQKTSPEIVIAWVDGDNLIRLRAASLPLLLDFESQFYP